MQAVGNAAVKKSYGDRRGIEWKEVLAGERAFHETGSWLPDETMEAFRTYKAVSYTHLDVYKRQKECLVCTVTWGPISIPINVMSLSP